METQRLIFQPPSMQYQPAMLEAIIESQHELAEFLPWVPYALTPEQSIENTEQAMENFAKFEGELRFSLLEKSTGQLVGAIGLIIRDKSVPFFEIGYWLRTSAVGQGYAQEALRCLEHYAFSDLNAERLEIRVAEGNRRSRMVAERAGYRLEATFHHDRRLPSGELTNTLVFAKFPSAT